MTKWLKIGAALLLLAWAPFIYAELTSSPAEKKERELPSVEPNSEEVEAEPIEPTAAAPDDNSPVAAEAEHHEGEGEGEHEADPEGDGEHEPQVEEQEGAAEALPVAPVAPEPVEPPAAEGEPGEEDPAAQEAEPLPPVAAGPTPQLERAFDTEPRDALWAKDTEGRIARIFGEAEAPEGMLEHASCRRAVCRIDVRWSGAHAAQYDSAYEALSEQFGPDFAVEPVGDADDEGHQVVHLYVLRKGYTAADLAE